MSTFEEERERNFAAYDRLRGEIPARYEGKYVAIADGRLMAVTDSFDEAVAAVKQYRHHLVFPAGSEPMDPVFIRRWTA